MIRDRITDFRRVKASDLLPNPRNWRTHPKSQQDALRGILAEVGYADALLARETPDGLMLKGDVYDPFIGSGTTLVAAEQLGRTCYAMEIHPPYVAVALERMAKMGLSPALQ